MNERKKIAFVCHPCHRGGVTRWMADAAMALAERGLEVYFVTVHPAKNTLPGKGSETMLQLLSKKKNDVRIIKAEVGYAFEFGTPAYRSHVYRQLIVKLPPGTPIILSDDPPVWAAATYLHGSFPVAGVLHADDDHYYWLAEKYFRQVDLFVCVSKRISETLKKRVTEFAPSRIYTIPCGINLPVMDVSIPPHPLLQLVYLGRISDFQKRAGDLVKICTLLAETNVQFHLNIIGDGEAKSTLQNKFIDARLQLHVTFCGWLTQEAVSEHLAAADILLLTSDFEGTPIAMMEALASGCGVVGTRVSGIEDYEQHPLAPDCLSVYAVGDIEGAVDKINRLSAIAVSKRRLAARKMAEKEFGMKACLDKYLTALSSIKTRSVPAARIKFPAGALLYSRAIAALRYIKLSIFKK